MYKYYKTIRFIAFTAILFTLFSSCDEENEVQQPLGYLAPLNLPEAIYLQYGEDYSIQLPDDYKNADVEFSLDFSSNDLDLGNGKNLQEILESAIEVNTEENKLVIESDKLYPNNQVSSITDVRLPETYKTVLTVSSLENYQPVSNTFSLYISAAKVEISGVDDSDEIPFSYHMYGEDTAKYIHQLKAPGLSLENTNWVLHQNGFPDQQVIVNEDKILFTSAAGSPENTAEWTYDLIPSLTKDGFIIASRQFRVFFIPEIKFFFGTYYPEYDLTVKTNIVHIALGEAYESSAPSFFPAEYKKSFLIESIQKDDEDFDNSEGIISINENNGAVKVAHNHSLEEGSYKIIVKATTDDANLTLETDLTLIMSVAEDDDHDH